LKTSSTAGVVNGLVYALLLNNQYTVSVKDVFGKAAKLRYDYLKMSRPIRTLSALFLLALVTLPIQQFWLRPLELTGTADWLVLLLTNWSAPVIVALAIIAVVRRRPQGLADYCLIGIFVLASAALIWQPQNLADLVIGWRYTLFATVGYWVGRSELIPAEMFDRYLRFALWAVIALSGCQLLLWVLGPSELITTLGLEQRFAAGDWWRLFGPMSGPNQLGTFTAIAATWLYWRKRLNHVELFLAVLVVGLTFSRSAFLGLTAGLALTPLVFAKTWRHRLFLAGGLLALVILAALAINNSAQLHESLVEARRADLRLEILDNTAIRFQQSSAFEWIFGHGAGTAGPAASVLQNGGFIPENWFLQIAYEFGLTGLLAILTFFGAIFWQSVRRQVPAIAAILLVIVVNSFFLHPLSDNFAAAIWFYTLLSVGLASGQTAKIPVE